ncbi:MAG: DUF5050 domain-containing protein [Lachnospiraceae bacterium]|nr:DUF5050 domain-containing protein [Lachnospiraceae bacterium]
MKTTRIFTLAILLIMVFALTACSGGSSSSGGNSESGPGRNESGNAADLGNSGDTSSISDNTAWPPPGGELIYAQVNADFSGSSDGFSFDVSEIHSISSVQLVFEGETKENFRRPEISDFAFYINGVPQELNEYMSFDYGSVVEHDLSWKASLHLDNVPGDEGMVTSYYYSVESKSDGLFDQPLAEYYFEMTVNGVPIRSNTFYWGEGVNFEFKDMPSFSAPVHLVPKRQILPLTPTTIAEHERGNINGNRFVALGNDWIYYVARYELYKMSLDGTDVEKIILDFPVTAINAVGDYIYIHSRHDLSTNEGYLEVDRIYRLKSDESELTILFERPINYEEGGSILGFVIVGEWLYYVTSYYETDSGDEFGGRNIIVLNRVRASDGTGDMQVTDMENYWLNIGSDWNYHLQTEWVPVPGSDWQGNMEYEIIRTRNDGAATEVILKLEDNMYIYNLLQSGDWVYYIDPHIVGISRVNVNTKETSIVIEDSRGAEAYIVDGDYLYFGIALDPDDWQRTLHRIKTDGTGLMRVGDMINPDGLHIAGDWVFNYFNNNIYRTRTDGSGELITVYEWN